LHAFIGLFTVEAEG
jgi:hypothetical protein